MAEKRKETAERMLVGDWSGARMLAARAAGSIGTDAWAMLAHSDRWSSFGGTVSWADNPFLVGGIEGFLPRPMVEESDLVWGFSYGFDDLVPLSLKETESPDEKVGEAVRKSRGSLFDARSRRAAPGRKAASSAAAQRSRPIVRGGGIDAPTPRAAETYREALEMVSLAEVARAGNDAPMTVGLPPQIARSMAESSGLLSALRMKGPAARPGNRPQARTPGIQTVVPVRTRSGGMSLQAGTAPAAPRAPEAPRPFDAMTERASGPSAATRAHAGRAAPGIVMSGSGVRYDGVSRRDSRFAAPAVEGGRPAARRSLTTLYDTEAFARSAEGSGVADPTFARTLAERGPALTEGASFARAAEAAGMGEGYVGLDRPDSVYVDMSRETPRAAAEAAVRAGGVFHKTLASAGMGPAAAPRRSTTASAPGGRPSIDVAMPRMDPAATVVASMGRELARSTGVAAPAQQGILAAGRQDPAPVPTALPVSMRPARATASVEEGARSSWPVPEPSASGRVLPQRESSSIAPFRTVTGTRPIGQAPAASIGATAAFAGAAGIPAEVLAGASGASSLELSETADLETIRLVEAGVPAATETTSPAVRGRKSRSRSATREAEAQGPARGAQTIAAAPAPGTPSVAAPSAATASGSGWPKPESNPVLSASGWPRGNAATGSMTSSFRFVPSESVSPAVVGVFSTMGEALQRLAVPRSGAVAGGGASLAAGRPSGGEGGFLEIEESERTFLMTRAGESAPREGTSSGPGGSRVRAKQVVNPERMVRAAQRSATEAGAGPAPARPSTAPVQTAVVVGRRTPPASTLQATPRTSRSAGAVEAAEALAPGAVNLPIGARMGRMARVAGVETPETMIGEAGRLTIADVSAAGGAAETRPGEARESTAYGLFEEGVMIALGLRGGREPGASEVPAVLPERTSQAVRASQAARAADGIPTVLTGTASQRFEAATRSRTSGFGTGTPIESRFLPAPGHEPGEMHELRIEGEYGPTLVSPVVAGRSDIRDEAAGSGSAARKARGAAGQAFAASSWKSQDGTPGERSAVSDVVGEISRTTTATRTTDVGGLERLFLVQKTLAKALRILSDESAAAADPTVRFLRNSAAAMDKVRASSSASSAGMSGGADAPELTLVETAARESDAVKPGRAQAASLPGIPGARDGLSGGSDGLDFVASSLSNSSFQPDSHLGSLFGGSDGGGAGRDNPMRGGMPLVSPVISVVAQQAMLAEDQPGTQVASTQPQANGNDEPQKGSAVDLDGLANEMADRIARRMKRDKERRGFYG